VKKKSELRQRIDILIGLQAVSLAKGKKQADQIRLLSLAGMGPTEISKLIGTTSNTVNVCLANLRSKDQLSLRERGDENE
jgi:hypothetical protein